MSVLLAPPVDVGMPGIRTNRDAVFGAWWAGELAETTSEARLRFDPVVGTVVAIVSLPELLLQHFLTLILQLEI